MTAAALVALAIAVFGAFSYGAGSILQAVGARRSRSTVRTLGHPLYLLGVGCDLLAWAGSMVALRELAVYQVQSVLAGSLAVTVVAARIFLKSRLRNRDVAAVMITIGALTVLAMSAGPQEHVSASTGLRFGFCAAALAAALIGWGATKVTSPGVVAALAGLCFGGSALCSRALPMPAQPMADPAGTALAVVTEPLTWAVVIFAAAGMLLYTNALQHGQVGPVTAVLWIGEVIAPSAVALLLLGDTVRPGWELSSTIAGLITVGAAVVLATAPATGATAQPGVEPDAEPAQAARTAIAVGMRWPSGPLMWWGQPPIWRPPDRTNPALPAATAAAELTWAPPRETVPAWAAPGPPDRHAIEAPRPAAPAVGRWPATHPARAYLPEPEPSWYQPAEAPPSRDPLSEAIPWWASPTDSQPIWRPPDRTSAARTPRPGAEPSWADRPNA